MPVRRFMASTAALIGLTLATAAAADPPTADPHFRSVLEVCGRCHTGLPFLGQARSWPRWNDVFRAMSNLGATGDEAQLEQATAFFLDHLTAVNVNTGSRDELVWVLDVSDEVAGQIIRRRTVKPFSTASELATVQGVRPERLALLGERLLF